MSQPLDIPIAHIDDEVSIAALVAALKALHGPDYNFAVGRWSGQGYFEPQPGQVIYRFMIAAQEARVRLQPGALVRGPSPDGPYRLLDAPFAETTAPHSEALWPGDVLSADGRSNGNMVLDGEGIYFEVTTEPTAYRAPRLALLRHLADYPGGCAAYPGAFRRETIPPQRCAPDASDRRGDNRVNEHTLDMRYDRTPPPIRHYHGPVAVGIGQGVNHSETAIVLPRSVYNLPEVGEPDDGRLIIYRCPATDPTNQVCIPVRPGSIVVTPATPENSMGHCFKNAFAMLIAIPGFVAPYHRLNHTI